MNRKIQFEFVEKLVDFVGSEWVSTDEEVLQDYLTDETPSTVCPRPATDMVLVKPSTTLEISKILKFANALKVPVFPRGGGTGLVGGCIPTERGIILSLERMNAVVEIDRENLMAVVEAGVTLEKLMETVNKAGFLFPPHPGDESAQVGGLVACNAGGARTVRYGVMRNYVKGIEVVVPTGEILTLGKKLLKNVAGYDLMHVIIGSQGTLGVITKVVLRLLPKFKETATLIVLCEDRRKALRIVPRILQRMIPLAIEYVERELMEKSAKQLGKEWPIKKGEVILIIIVTGNSKEELYLDAQKIDEIAREHDVIDVFVVENRRKQDDILTIRSNIYSYLKPYVMDVLDVAVPPASITELMDALDEIAKEYRMYLPIFGHVGDGNVHPHILTKEAGGVTKEALEKVKKAVYDITIRLGGTITAEHGIGKIRTQNLIQYSDGKAVEIMKNIKKVFDPNNILNPGTVVLSNRSTES